MNRIESPARSGASSSVFEKVLLAFESGDFAYSEVLAQLKRVLATGASPQELSEILRRREEIAPLPKYAHDEFLALLDDATAAAATAAAATVSAPPTPTSAPATATVPASRRNDGTRRATIAAPAAVFEKILGAFETGGFTFDDVVAQLTRLLGTGTAPKALLEILRRRGEIEPLPEYAHAQLAGLLHDAIQREAQPSPDPTTVFQPTSAPPPVSALPPLSTRIPTGTRVAPARGTSSAPPSPMRNAAVAQGTAASPARPLASPSGGLRALEEQIARQNADYEALSRSYELARGAASAAEERAAALAADLAAARAALESERSRARETAQSLAESLASGAAARSRCEDALREAGRNESESQALRASLTARDAALVQARRSLADRDAALAQARRSLAESDTQLAERDARIAERETQLAERDAQLAERGTQLAALQREHAAVHSVLEARTDAGGRMQEEMQAARAGAAALTADLAAARAALTARDAALAQARRSLTERDMQSVREPDRAAPLPASGRGAPRPVLNLPLLGAGVALLAIAGAALFFSRHRPVAAPAPAPPPTAALPAAGTVIQDCPTCPAMTVLPAGRFIQGADPTDPDAPSSEKPPHVVRIGHSFAMSSSAVTVAEFQQFIAASGADMQGCDTYDGEWKHHSKNSWKDPGFVQTGEHPVTCASWNDAQGYVRWLSAKTGHRYRLPSASEWEYAARAGGVAAHPWNADGSGACANANVADQSAAHRYPGWTAFACDDGYVYTAPVGSFKANAFGLKDMLGNVFQWTEDCWRADYGGAPIDGSARSDGDCAEHELRGGSWFSIPAYVRANYRNHFAADYRTSTVGIRLVRDIEP